jgi:hypothetical protein
MNYPIEATCQCGQVSYILTKPPQKVIACHCTECQKLASGPFSVSVIIDADTVVFRGEMKEWSRPADSGNRNHAKFCPDCGNRIYHYSPNDPLTIKLKLKPVRLSDNSLWQPTAHIWLSEKQDWYQVPEGVSGADKQT